MLERLARLDSLDDRPVVPCSLGAHRIALGLEECMACWSRTLALRHVLIVVPGELVYLHLCEGAHYESRSLVVCILRNQFLGCGSSSS